MVGAGGTAPATATKGRAVVFAPLPLLTVTIENRGGKPDIHLHAGGQGVWQARMIKALGQPVTLCGLFGGETGVVVQRLIQDEGIDVCGVRSVSRNGSYVHDRRAGQRVELASMPGDPPSRHELDELYNATLVEGLAASACLLSGPADPATMPAQIYRRLALDLSGDGRPVVADLRGDHLSGAIRGGANVIKVSHEELLDDGRASEDAVDSLIDALRNLRSEGPNLVVVSRAAEPALAMVDDKIYMVIMPRLEPADPRGAGDSMTAGITAALARGEPPDQAVRLGAAAGSLNVTRSGLGTGNGAAVIRIMEHVSLEPLATADPSTGLG